EGFHKALAGVLADEVDDGDELACRLDGNEAGIFGVGRGEGGVRDFLVSAGGGVCDLEHANAVTSGAEEEAASNVESHFLAGGEERGTVNGSEEAGLVTAEGDGAAGREDEGLG